MANINDAITQAVQEALQAALQGMEGLCPTQAPKSRTERYCMTVKQLAERMQVSLPTAYDMTHIDGFPIITVGRKRLIPIEAFEQWLAEQAGKAV